MTRSSGFSTRMRRRRLGSQRPSSSGSRFVVGLIVAAQDERDFAFLPGLAFEKLKGKRAHQHSLRLNDQWRLIIELRGKGPRKIIGVVEIADYH